MIDTLIVIAIVAAIAAVAFFKFIKPKLDAAKVPTVELPHDYQAPPIPHGSTVRHDYTTPDASTIKDQASWEAYRDQLAPSTRAFTREVAYGPDGKPLDAGGREIKPGSADFGPIPEAQCAVPGSISVIYRGSPITLAPVAGKTNMNAGVHALMFGADGRTLADVRPGADGGQFHIDAKMGEAVLVQLDGPPNVYMVKP